MYDFVIHAQDGKRTSGAAALDAMFSIRMPRQTLATLRAAAAAEGRSASAYALRVIQRHLADVISREDA